MSHKSVMSELASLIRESCKAQLDAGEGNTREVAEAVYDLYPDLCEEASKDLILNKLVDMARKTFKEWTAATDEVIQLSFPGLDKDIAKDLSAVVAIPRGGSFYYKHVAKASIEELELADEALEKQIAFDQKKRRALREFIEYRKAHITPIELV